MVFIFFIISFIRFYGFVPLISLATVTSILLITIIRKFLMLRDKYIAWIQQVLQELEIYVMCLKLITEMLLVGLFPCMVNVL